MTTYHLAISLPDEFESLQHLEMLVDTEGQKLKQVLFEKVLAQVTQKQKTTHAEPPICPHCQKKTAKAEGRKKDT